MKIEIDKNEFDNVQNIRALAKAHNQTDFGNKAIALGMDYDEFKRTLLTTIANDEPLNLPSIEMDSRSFDFGKAFTQFVEGKEIDGLEGEWQQELKRSRPLSTTNSFYVPSTRALGSSAPLSSLNVQDVVRSGQQNNLWEALGLSIYNIADGRARIPSETELAVAQTIDFDGSNSANDVAPTYSAVDLVPSSVTAFCSVSRNLVNRQSVDVESVVGESLRRSLGLELENQIIGGNGTHPIGFC